MTPFQVVAALRSAGCVYAEEEAELLLADGRDPAALVARRASGEPLEQVLGWAELCGLRIRLRPGVFVPRRRTELLAREAARRLPPGGVAVDLCTGSGAVAAVLASVVQGAEVYAVDVDPVAVACARDNLPDATVLQGDLDEPLPDDLRGRVDVLVANTPYVPSDEVALLPAEARDHEPRHTLDGGADGLALMRRMSAIAPAWLRPGGSVLVEVSERQLPVALDVLRGDGLEASWVEDDDLGATVVVGRR